MSLADGVTDLREPLALHTCGDWDTEQASAAAFDQAVMPSGLFRVYREVPGELMQPRPGQVEKTVRIDRVLIPENELLLHGWTLGAIGVEVKRSGTKAGPALAQAMDYARSVWTVRGVLIQLGAVFLWPLEKQPGTVASIMAHNLVGGVTPPSAWTLIQFHIGEANVLRVRRDGAVEVGVVRSGTKVGSR